VDLGQCIQQARASAWPSFTKGWRFSGTGNNKIITAAEAKEVGAGDKEMRGKGFEIVSPGPPNVPSGADGWRQVLEAMSVLKHIGIQTGPEPGLHIHVNALKESVAGKKLTQRQIAYVWAAYAKYQLVINEMLSPVRIGSKHCRELFLDNAKGSANRVFFNHMHNWLRTGRGGPFWGGMPRGSALNYHALGKYGTIEFRQGSPTIDEERMGRWLQFVVAFVERFGMGGGGATGMREFFSAGSADADYKKLQLEQQKATMADLFHQLGSNVDRDSEKYFSLRKWEHVRNEQGELVEDRTCHLQFTPVEVKPVGPAHCDGGR